MPPFSSWERSVSPVSAPQSPDLGTGMIETIDFVTTSRDSSPDIKPTVRWPNGLVVFWKNEEESQKTHAGILCPYHNYGKIEEHVLPLETLNDYSEVQYVRQCHEKKSLPFTVTFPYDDDQPATANLGWSKNITNERYQVQGLDIPELAASEHNDIKTGGLKPKQLTRVSTSCYKNDQNEHIDKAGNTLLAIASRCGNVKSMRTYLEAGAEVNSQNYDGITPLMHAAVNGQVNSVLLLLEKGACKEIKNVEGLKAIEMLGNLFHTKDTVNFTDTADIIDLLRPDDYLPRRKHDRSVPVTNLGLLKTVHDAQNCKGRTILSGTITLEGPCNIAKVRTPDVMRKTLASLHLGSPYQTIHTTSGRTNDLRSPDNFLNNYFWTKVVLHFAKVWNIYLPPHAYDVSSHQRCPKGTTSASHAEKKLIAFLVIKYPLHLKRALGDIMITVNKKPCQSCIAFKEEAERRSGLKIIFKVIRQRFIYPEESQTSDVPKTPTRRQPSRKVNESPLLTPPPSSSRAGNTASSYQSDDSPISDQSEESDDAMASPPTNERSPPVAKASKMRVPEHINALETPDSSPKKMKKQLQQRQQQQQLADDSDWTFRSGTCSPDPLDRSVTPRMSITTEEEARLESSPASTVVTRSAYGRLPGNSMASAIEID